MFGKMVGVLVAVLTVFCAAGCGRKSPPQQSKPAAQKSAVPLPEWAPKNPSPEFLRAAKALRPVPVEEYLRGAHGDKAVEAMLLKSLRFWPATYEFFGTLTDEQIEKFGAEKEIRIRPKDLTERQRAAMDAWFAAFRQAMKGSDPALSDYQILLYTMGAKEDLSNVRVGFKVDGGHMVQIYFWVTPPGGKEDSMCTWFAEI